MKLPFGLPSTCMCYTANIPAGVGKSTFIQTCEENRPVKQVCAVSDKLYIMQGKVYRVLELEAELTCHFLAL